MNKLVIGGPRNGERVDWCTEYIYLPDEVEYRLVKLVIEDEAVMIYVSKDLSNEQALEMLQVNYLGI